MKPAAAQQFLKYLMRTMGTIATLAVVPIFFPFAWMNSIHQWLGLGELPSDPIVIYLARSTSAFYFMVGVYAIAFSTDIPRYRPLVKLWAMMISLMGLILLGIDLSAGMPWYWTLGEGPPLFVIGLLATWLFSQTAEKSGPANFDQVKSSGSNLL